MQREIGSVKWFSSEKGYGFIQRDGLEDVFVHYSEIAMDGFRKLDAGEAVEFEIIRGKRGPKAHKVLRANGEPIVGGRLSNGGSDQTNGSTRLAQQIRNFFSRN